MQVDTIFKKPVILREKVISKKKKFNFRKLCRVVIILIFIFSIFLFVLSIFRLKTKAAIILSEVKEGKAHFILAKDFILQKNDPANAKKEFQIAFENFSKVKKELINVPALDRNSFVLSLTELGELFSELGINLINEDYKSAKKILKEINFKLEKLEIEKLPKDLRDLFLIGKAAFKAFDPSLKRDYLLLFQNNRELRPTGGFIGTYGILSIKDFEIKRLFIDSIYNPDGQLSEKIDPPEPLKLVTNNWAMRDANWYFDFRKSADKIVEFFEKEGGFTPYGVIAMTPTVFERLLEITGPIYFEKYNLYLNASNFVDLVQKKTSKRNRDPKRFLKDFTPLFLEKLNSLKLEKKIKIFKEILDLLERKHILLFFYDKDLQNLVEKFGFDGRIKNTSLDYLAIVNANLGGAKSSLDIEEKIELKVQIDFDGSVINTLSILKNHCGSYNWPSGINFNYLRILVPEGSKLISAFGFDKKESLSRDENGIAYKRDLDGNLDIRKEGGKTSFGGWLVTLPSEQRLAVVSYRLPFKTKNKYSLLFQKQPGIDDTEIKVFIKLPKGKKLIKSNFFFKKEKDFYSFSFSSEKDQFLEIDFQ